MCRMRACCRCSRACSMRKLRGHRCQRLRALQLREREFARIQTVLRFPIWITLTAASLDHPHDQRCRPSCRMSSVPACARCVRGPVMLDPRASSMAFIINAQLALRRSSICAPVLGIILALIVRRIAPMYALGCSRRSINVNAIVSGRR